MAVLAVQCCPTYALNSDFDGWDATLSRSLLLVLQGNDGSCINNAIWVLLPARSRLCLAKPDLVAVSGVAAFAQAVGELFRCVPERIHKDWYGSGGPHAVLSCAAVTAFALRSDSFLSPSSIRWRLCFVLVRARSLVDMLVAVLHKEFASAGRSLIDQGLPPFCHQFPSISRLVYQCAADPAALSCLLRAARSSLGGALMFALRAFPEVVMERLQKMWCVLVPVLFATGVLCCRPGSACVAGTLPRAAIHALLAPCRAFAQ